MRKAILSPLVCFAVGLANAAYGLTIAPIPWISVAVSLFAFVAGGYLLGSIHEIGFYDPYLKETWTVVECQQKLLKAQNDLLGAIFSRKSPEEIESAMKNLATVFEEGIKTIAALTGEGKV